MAKTDDLTVNGYCFGSYEDANAALKEMKNAQYLEERINSMSLKQMIAVYNKMIDEKMFKTPVGWEYLKYLRERIVQQGEKVENLRPIPLYVTFTTDSSDDKSMEHVAKMYVKNNQNTIEKVRSNLKNSIILNAVLIILVIAMLIITLKAPTPNMLNYKQAITNQYSEWEQELTQRENKIKERELQLEDTGSGR